MIVWPGKDPDDVLDFTWIVPLDESDSISTFTPTILVNTTTPITLGAEAISGANCSVFISAGSADEVAQIDVKCVTALGRTFNDVCALPIIDRANSVVLNFRRRYPAFASVADGPIAFWLVKAAVEVADGWPEAVRDDAKACWAAHQLVATGVLASAVPSGVQSFRSGDFQATISNTLASMTGLSSTEYGREYVRMRRAYFAGPRLAWAPDLP